MKSFILFILLTSVSHAGLHFSVEKSDPDTMFKLELTDSDKSVEVVKTSNWFDRKKDLRLGQFTSDAKDFKPILAKLSEINQKVKKADEVLKQHGSSINDLNSLPIHNTYFVIDGIKILPYSPFYKPLMDIAADIDTRKMKLIEGVELAENKKEYMFFEKSKVVSKEKFDAGFFCDALDHPVKCQARKWGVLFLN